VIERVPGRRAPIAALAAIVASSVAAGCGGSDDRGDELVVSAAASLEPAFLGYAGAAGIEAKQSFAGSDELAAQIRQGLTPDVYAAANTALPGELNREGLVGEPVVFASNRLVLAVPAGSGIGSLDDLAGGEVAIAIGEEGVPVGDYTREVLAGLPSEQRAAILDRVRSEEPDVSGVVGKLIQGAVDAGFVYVTDVVATGGTLEAIELPSKLEPEVGYGAAVVDGAADPEAAREFVDGLLDGPGAEALRGAGFGPPPGARESG
jgi:molybdate transport system substrate-binding protein